MTARTRFTALLAVVPVALAACSAKEEPKTPIATAQGGSPQRDNMPAGARSALDSGNALLRAGDAKGAVAQYVAAANADPDNAAPWYGVMMAAQRVGDTKLADSAAAMVRKKSGNPQLTDSSMQKMHAEGAGAGPLPPGHPAPEAMPPGHPPMGGAPAAPKAPATKKTT
jgi:hypothetical protein